MSIMEICLGALLLICAITDLKTKEISMRILLIFGALGIIIFILGNQNSVAEELVGVLVGIGVLLICRVTGGKIGAGDGFLIVVTGIFLGGMRNVELLMGGFLLAALWALILVIFRKVNWKKELPFVPFLFLSFIRMVVF